MTLEPDCKFDQGQYDHSGITEGVYRWRDLLTINVNQQKQPRENQITFLWQVYGKTFDSDITFNPTFFPVVVVEQTHHALL